jgi:hypothetical protein
MPAAPKDLPNAIERSAMQRLVPTRGLAAEKIGAGRRVIANLMAKGWIERCDGGYRLTSAGQEVFKRPIPLAK